MTPRSIRRAQERKAQKQARKEARNQSLDAAVAAVDVDTAATATTTTVDQVAADAESELSTNRSTTLQQLQANRRNAQFSTGPRTAEGKAACSRNALKTGLTGKTVLLPSEDAALYQQHVNSFYHELQPVGDRETELTQSIADAKWRLARIPSLEFGIYALGRLQLSEEFAQYSAAEAAALIEAKTFLTFQRQLNNLSIQESRLRRQSEKDTAELSRLQQLRATAKSKQALASTPKKSAPASPSREIGFEFDTSSRGAEQTASDLDFDTLFALPQAA